MSKYCRPMGLYVTYLDCMECEDKECRQPQRKEKEEMKYNPKLEVGQRVFYVVGDKTKQCVVNATVQIIMISKNGISYILNEGTVVHAGKKSIFKKGDKVGTQHINESSVDTGEKGFSSYATFTTKEKCVKWLKAE